MTTDSDLAMDLVYDIYDGSDDMMPPLPPVLILHGIFDCKENWREIAQEIADRSVRMVYVPDIRNHGKSPKTPDFSFPALVSDAERFIKKLNEPVVLIGHSLGGSVASSLALNKPDLVDKLILIDISPVDYPLETENKISAAAMKLQEVIQALPKHLNFNEAITGIQRIFENTNINPVFRKIALPTLTKNENGVQWNTNIPAVVEHICLKKTVRKKYPLPGIFNKEALVVYGSLSNYITLKDYGEIKKTIPKVHIDCINGSDHWIHVEKKLDLLDSILSFLIQQM